MLNTLMVVIKVRVVGHLIEGEMNAPGYVLHMTYKSAADCFRIVERILGSQS